jgi:hypothetical protein
VLNAARDIDASIDRLDEALRAHGLAGIEQPQESGAIDDVAEGISPYLLPAELRRFWERVDVARLAIDLFPPLCDAAGALELQRAADEFTVPATPPPLFLVIGYASHVHRSIELASKWDDGGTIIWSEWVDGGFRISYRSLSDLLDVVSELVAEGAVERNGDRVYVPYQAEEEKQTPRLLAQPHPLYGDAIEISDDLRSWPTHWLEASGVDLADRVPRGATHTIAELAEAAAAGLVTGRVHGEIVRLVGSSDGSLVVVDDGTGQLDVWCPSGVSLWGPIHRERFELEVTVESPVHAPPDLDTGHAEVQRHALAGRIEDAQAAAEKLFGRIRAHRASAFASDLRPLD